MSGHSRLKVTTSSIVARTPFFDHQEQSMQAADPAPTIVCFGAKVAFASMSE